MTSGGPFPRLRSPGHAPYTNLIEARQKHLYKNAEHCIFSRGMGSGKAFRQGQILRLISGEPITNQEELRRRLAAHKMRVTQATLSRDLHELRLVKTQEGYKTVNAVPQEPVALPLPPLARALREFLVDIRPAENLLVLKTPPSGAQPLAAAVDGARYPEVAGTIAGDDTVLIITSNKRMRESLQKKMEALVK